MRKRWLLGAISGFFFGLSLSIILLGLHVVRLDSVVLTLLPVIGLVLGVAGALGGPRRPRQRASVGAPPDVSEFTGTPPTAPPPPTEALAAPPESPPTHAATAGLPPSDSAGPAPAPAPAPDESNEGS